MPEERELTELVARGFAGVRDQIRERDDKVSSLSDKMIGVEFKIDQLKETLSKVETEMSNERANRTENERIKMRVEHLEECYDKHEKKQAENAKWIKGLVASVIVLLLGFLFNFIRIGLR